jgi:hypothetical protein
MVCAVLAVARQASPSTIRVRSDGDEAQWSLALKWASTVLGRDIPFPVSETYETPA